MPTGAVPVATSRPRGGWHRWVFWVVQAVASCRQTAFVAIAPVAEILEPANAAAPEVAVHMHMPLPTGPSRPAPCLVAPASSLCRRSAWSGRCRHVHPTLGRLSWRGTGPPDTSDRRRRVWARRRGLGGGAEPPASPFFLGKGIFLGSRLGEPLPDAQMVSGGIGWGRGEPQDPLAASAEAAGGTASSASVTTRARMPPAAPVCRPPHPSRAGWRAQTRRAAAALLG